MRHWVAKPWPFRALDYYVNTSTNLSALATTLSSGGSAGWGAGGVFSGTSYPSSHFSTDWLPSDVTVNGNPKHMGGMFWPYLDQIDVAEILRLALRETVQMMIDTAGTKRHSTLWVCVWDPPPLWKSVPVNQIPARVGDPLYSMALHEQKSRFEVAIQQDAHVINLVIGTPMPLPQVIAVHEQSISEWEADSVWIFDVDEEALGEFRWLRSVFPPDRSRTIPLEPTPWANGPDKTQLDRGLPFIEELDL